eukprot:scaffold23427_cov68-Phaeocystis_antarctica.AAC.8
MRQRQPRPVGRPAAGLAAARALRPISMGVRCQIQCFARPQAARCLSSEAHTLRCTKCRRAD